MPDFLQQMAEASMRRAADARAVTPEAEMRRAAEAMPPPRKFRPSEFAVIAEIKRVSPAAGVLQADANPAARARDYEAAGAAAISVLTEPARFGGRLADLRAAKSATGLPVMRKDFIADAYQLYEARAAGADGVLLIAAMCSDRELRHYLRVCEYLGMFALVEAFNEADIERAQCAGAEFVGVNCRNLRDLSVDFARFEELRRLIDPDRIAIAESGISTPEQLQHVRDLDYRGALIGSALMQATDPADALRKLLMQESRP
jgi:indole-3-glycerol phosphate synthase